MRIAYSSLRFCLFLLPYSEPSEVGVCAAACLKQSHLFWLWGAWRWKWWLERCPNGITRLCNLVRQPQGQPHHSSLRTPVYLYSEISPDSCAARKRLQAYITVMGFCAAVKEENRQLDINCINQSHFSENTWTTKGTFTFDYLSRVIAVVSLYYFNVIM